jgi:hypothetical protein
MRRLPALTFRFKTSFFRAASVTALGLLGLTTAWALGACSFGFPESTGAGGSGGSVQATTGFTTGTGFAASTGVGGGSTCDIIDGVCNSMAGEDCACVDCAMTAFCNPDQCVTDGVCDPLDDSCICPDCDNTHYCGDPAKKNCTDDGMCDSFYEGCGCADCAAKPHCADLLATCEGGHLDGACAAGEPCTCPDCFGLAQCVPCQSPGTCMPGDPCSCAGCETTAVCSNLAGCVDDGICDILDEGCPCVDCATTPACQIGSGTSGAGGSGSTSSTGSASSSGSSGSASSSGSVSSSGSSGSAGSSGAGGSGGASGSGGAGGATGSASSSGP